MAYTKKVWIDEVLAGSERYDIKENDGSAFKSNMQISLATTVVTAGTAMEAGDMNNIEEGLETASENSPAASLVNRQSITGNKTLVNTDEPIQSLDPDADRDVNLPTVASANHAFYIINRDATFSLTVKNSGGTTIGVLAAGKSGLFISDGLNNWYSVALPGSASESASGIVELATSAEINTGTDATRAISPDALAGANLGKRIIQLKVMDESTSLTTGDGKLIFCVPSELNGMNLVDADAYVTTVATGATLINVDIRNVTDSTDMLSTNITIDASEYTSYTAATPPVINASADDVATGDLISIDIDAIGNTTPGKGLGVILSFQLP